MTRLQSTAIHLHFVILLLNMLTGNIVWCSVESSTST